MTKLLVVETSPRGDHSISRGLTRRFVGEWQATHPYGEVIERDLMETELPFVNAPWLQAYFTPAQQHSPEMKAVLRLSDELVAELLAADHLVIATPVYNYKASPQGLFARQRFLGHKRNMGYATRFNRAIGSLSGWNSPAGSRLACSQR